MPFSAHPKLNARGHLWNFGVMGKTLIAYRVKPDGTPGQLQIAPLPVASAMVHDAAITERYLVIPLPPLRIDIAGVQGGSSFADAIRWAADEPLRWLVAPKDDIAQQRIFETPAQMVFHVGNAHETRDGHIELSYVGAPSGAFLLDEAAALMRGDVSVSLAQPRTMRVRLDLAQGSATRDAFDDVSEFPRVDPRFVGMRARYLVSPAHWRDYPGRPRLWFHGVQLRDMDTGKVQRFDYGRDAIAEEHVIVARPGTARELDGWIIGTTYDVRLQATRVNVFDALRVGAGPIAVAELPYGLPLGFHGSFAPA
jgi:carotenoid cleavage dioxygenase